MKNIKDCFDNYMSLSESLALDMNANVNEGLKDAIKNAKRYFSKVFTYAKRTVALLDVYFAPIDEEGYIIPAIMPATIGMAYKQGYINKKNTYIYLDPESARLAGVPTSMGNPLKVYGDEDQLSYWRNFFAGKRPQFKQISNITSTDSNIRNIFFESNAEDAANILEVKLASDAKENSWNIIKSSKQLEDIIYNTIMNHTADLLIWGAPGIGKTAIVENLTSAKGRLKDYQLIVKTLSQETADSFKLPAYTGEGDDRRATDLPKTWLPVYKKTGDKVEDAKRDEACGKGILFIDELSRARQDVLNVMLPVIQSRTLGDNWIIGSGWTIIAASNRLEDESNGGQSKLGNALGNRFRQVYFEPDVDGWVEWAKSQGYISPILLTWLTLPESNNMSGRKYFYYDPNEFYSDDSYSTLFCTPRSWTNAMYELSKYARTGSLSGFEIFDIDENTLGFALNGYIPATAINAFMSFLRVIKSLAESTGGDLTRTVEGIWTGQVKGTKIASAKDMVNVAIPLAQLVFSARVNKFPTSDEFKNLANWLAKQNNTQLAQASMDMMQAIMFGGIEDLNINTGDGSSNIKLKLIAGILSGKLKKDPALVKSLESAKSIMAGFMKQYGFSNVLDIPDLSEGFMILAKAYHAEFSKYEQAAGISL